MLVKWKDGSGDIGEYGRCLSPEMGGHVVDRDLEV
jgi:hypothetical protein